MNQSASQITQQLETDDDAIDLASYLNLLIDYKWMIFTIASFVLFLGVAYVIVATPVYQANILVQVEDSASSSKNILGDLSGVFDLKTAATAEMEILRSRFVVTRAVQNLGLNINIEPKYFPLIGRAIARRNKQLSEPGLFGIGPYAWGAEQAKVAQFNVPKGLEDAEFLLTARQGGKFRLTDLEDSIDFEGIVGETIKKETSWGPIVLHIARMDARPGVQFKLSWLPILAAVEDLQSTLQISEKGKQSGIIAVTLEGGHPDKTADILNNLGQEYIRQNVERKAEEAEKSLVFLDKQLPEVKRNLETAEANYSALRNSKGTIDLGEEAKSLLTQSVFAQTRLLELKQKRDELLTRFQDTNPLVATVNQQLGTVNAELASVNAKIGKMPSTEQEVLRLTRNVKVSTDLYTTLLNNVQQLQLLKASKVGNARLLDKAVPPLKPVRPNRMIVIALSGLIGLFLGVIGALVRRSLFGGIDDPREIEKVLGVNVSAAVPHSDAQERLTGQLASGAKTTGLLINDFPDDPAIESLRSLRTSLQFSMLGAKNNIIMIIGATPGLGKTFVASNFSGVIASTGKRTLLIDGDLRKGHLHRYFGLPRKGGLSEVIAGQMTLENAVHVSQFADFHVLTAGTHVPKPSEILSHGNMAKLLKLASEQYDFVVIDTAPVLAASDALVIAPHAGVIYGVARRGASKMGELEETAKRIAQTGMKLTGFIFNDIDLNSGRYGYGSRNGRYRYVQYNY
jgi:tyrosine-protein kinase Etk/Wzc